MSSLSAMDILRFANLQHNIVFIRFIVANIKKKSHTGSPYI